MELLEKAQRWAARGHLGVYRKFGNIPYIVHPEAVAEIVSQVTDDTEVLAAAWLHDIVEDTKVSVNDIERAFNTRIAKIVWEVSKISDGCICDRNTKVVMNCIHYGNGSKDSKIIKIADAIHNLPTMIRDNPKFAPRYISEKKLLLHYIKDGHPLLASIVYKIVEDYERLDPTVFHLYNILKSLTNLQK
jgi:guanosine-3',5'-bis(diphosphate) 3'-pyrophosphohydrolase